MADKNPKTDAVQLAETSWPVIEPSSAINKATISINKARCLLDKLRYDEELPNMYGNYWKIVVPVDHDNVSFDENRIQKEFLQGIYQKQPRPHVNNAWLEGPWNTPQTALDTAQNESKEMFMENSSEAAHQLYLDAVNNCKAMTKEYNNLYKHYVELGTSHNATVNELVKLSFLRNSCKNLTHKWNVTLHQKNELQQQCSKVMSLCDNAIRERDSARAQVVEAHEYIALLTVQKNTALQQISLLMSERDTMFKEKEQMQEELNKAHKMIQPKKICVKELKEPTFRESSRNCFELDSACTAGAFSQKYTNLKLLYNGTFGCVTKGFNNSSGLFVITKFISKNDVYNDVMMYSEKMQKNVPIEVALSQTIEHPNLIKVLDVFENDFYYQLVMEKHGCGMDLHTFVNLNKCRDEPLISYIFRQIVTALKFLQSKDIVHRDVKVGNCVIDENFHVKLIDFGSAAKVSQGPFTKYFGTELYSGPEYFRNEEYKGEEVEMYALGVTLFVLAFGNFPFDNKEDILYGNYDIPDCASEELYYLISNLLDRVPDRWFLEDVCLHRWVTRPVKITNYSFSDVVDMSAFHL